MECAFAITGKDFVLIASDMSAGRSIIQMKSNENKITPVGPNLAMACGGEPGDTSRFADYVDRNLRLYHIRNNFPLPPPSAASWVRRILAESIRSRSPYAVNVLLGGFDTTTSKPHLYWLDYLGTKADIPYAAQGVGMYVTLSTMDKWWYENIERREALDVLNKCVDEVKKRVTIKFDFNCVLIDKDGVHSLDLKSQDPIAELEAKVAAMKPSDPEPIIPSSDAPAIAAA
ncbi:20S proteasome subunit beta 4 [Tremella mesenterica]|uniref:Proteasome subunit beta n=1 Tax=Tremella mesenterica TaxID=5217 RepID=A0A4Q1BE16_TREME|nr:uncharacterized protein TREMEDRAFT_36819 [Tremella mesenterica DSM 1558]EIW72628.1 hypothetical protein TREMEDRAFT_36819 [Tremella mesenterica DSM 1558]RXK36184.1 20S proteasome subunit beta 4 [Tremella mesenterica]